MTLPTTINESKAGAGTRARACEGGLARLGWGCNVDGLTGGWVEVVTVVRVRVWVNASTNHHFSSLFKGACELTGLFEKCTPFSVIMYPRNLKSAHLNFYSQILKRYSVPKTTDSPPPPLQIQPPLECWNLNRFLRIHASNPPPHQTLTTRKPPLPSRPLALTSP